MIFLSYHYQKKGASPAKRDGFIEKICFAKLRVLYLLKKGGKVMDKEKNNKEALLPLHHYDSVLDPKQLENGRVEGLNVYELSLKGRSEELN